MTAERLPTFTPSPDYHSYRVTLLEDRWDAELGKFRVTVHAIGPLSARELAVEQSKGKYPSACAVAVEQLCDGCDPHEAHAGQPCGHTSQSASAVYPCPCGRELETQYEWGFL